MLEIKKNYMKFNGYYHEKQENLPVERLIHVGEKIHLIRIDSVKQYDMDTSRSFYDEEVGGDICLFPSYTVEISFTPIKKDLSKDDFYNAIQDIKADDTLIETRESEKWREQYAQYSGGGREKVPVVAEAVSETD